MSLGSNIRKRRYELNMSQQELADFMGYKTRSTIAKIESGTNDVSHAKLRKFAQVLDTSYEALTAGTEELLYEAPDAAYHPITASEKKSKNAVVILAGGKSVRNHQNVPNQFIQILGKPVIVYCLEAYQNHPAVDDIYIVCLKGWEEIVQAYARQYNISKLRGLITGGASGIDSVKKAYEALNETYLEDDVLIFQESTRPMVSVDMISKLLQACSLNGSATICQSMRDNVQFTVDGYHTRYIDRESIVDLQSPEAHTFARLKEVFEKAKNKQHPMTESCCALFMHNLGFNINFIEGSTNNLKIVRQEDIVIATAMLKYIGY